MKSYNLVNINKKHNNRFVQKAESLGLSAFFASFLAFSVNYNGSYKFAFEALHGESGGNLYYIDSASASDCDISIRSDLLTVTDEVARRSHLSRIHD